MGLGTKTLTYSARNPLAFPAGVAPSVNLQSPLANGVKLAMVSTRSSSATAPSFIDLFNPSKKFVTGGTIASGIDGAIGPYAATSSFGSISTAASYPTTINHTCTFAGIFRTASSVNATPIFCDSNTTSACGILITTTSGGVLQLTKNNNATAVSSALTALAVNTPYFIAVSQNDSTSNGFVNFVIRRLDNGKIWSAKVANLTAVTVAAGTAWSVSNVNAGGSSAGPRTAAAMHNNAFAATLHQLLQLAEDPWSLWYSTDLPTYVGATAGTVSGVWSSAGAGDSQWAGASTAASVWSSTGQGASQWAGAATAAGIWSAAGQGSAQWTGLAIAAGTWSAAGLGDSQWTGAATAASIWSSAGLGDSQWTGISTAAAVWSSTGLGDSQWSSGGSIVSAVWSATGTGAAQFTGASTVAAVWNASGTGAAQWSGASVFSAAWAASGIGGATWRSSAAPAFVEIYSSQCFFGMGRLGVIDHNP